MLAFFLDANYFPNGKNCLAITVTSYQTSSMKFPPNMVGLWRQKIHTKFGRK